MGRGAQCDGTNVLRMRLNRNGATAIALEMRGKRTRTRAGEKEAKKSTAAEVEAAMQQMRFSNDGEDHRKARASRNQARALKTAQALLRCRGRISRRSAGPSSYR
jgi:hypothetical protein